MIGIYKITSPTGRIYIGQAVSIEKRKKSYEKSKCKGQTRLYASLVKYGFCEHLFEVIEECSIEELNTRERHWQDFYDVLGLKGLNCKLQSTVEHRMVHSQESIDKQSATMRAFYTTSAGKASRARGVANTDWVGCQEKRIAKIVKPIDQYLLDGTHIAEWLSGTQASNLLKINRGNISACLVGRYKSAGGFIWKYK
jgi:group I intron endonuclease